MSEFRSAEEWLAARGIERDPIRVPTDPTPAEQPSGTGPSTRGEQPPVAPHPGGDPAEPGDGRTPVSMREAARLATEAPTPEPAVSDEDDAGPRGTLDEEISRAVAYARRATSQSVMSEGRLRSKLESRDHPKVVIDRAIERCRRERLVDDEAYAAAFVDERRRKGHAPFRVKQDLRKRGFADDLIARAIAPLEAQDREAQAFDAARGKAATLRSLAPDTAFRRLVGYLARRGYPEGLARKVAREVVYADREQERTSTR